MSRLLTEVKMNKMEDILNRFKSKTVDLYIGRCPYLQDFVVESFYKIEAHLDSIGETCIDGIE